MSTDLDAPEAAWLASIPPIGMGDRLRYADILNDGDRSRRSQRKSYVLLCLLTRSSLARANDPERRLEELLSLRVAQLHLRAARAGRPWRAAIESARCREDLRPHFHLLRALIAIGRQLNAMREARDALRQRRREALDLVVPDNWVDQNWSTPGGPMELDDEH